MKTILSLSLKVALKRIAFTQLLLFLIVIASFGQEKQKNEKIVNVENEWWIPILLKHKIEMKGSNNFKNIFEMGETNSVKDGVCTLTNAFVILLDKSGNYSIIESPQLTHDFNKELIITNEGTIKVFKKDSKPNEPITFIQIQHMELKYPRN
jgi:hypothetical protein